MGDLSEEQVLEEFEKEMNSLDIGTIRMDRQRAQRLNVALNPNGKPALPLLLISN